MLRLRLRQAGTDERGSAELVRRLLGRSSLLEEQSERKVNTSVMERVKRANLEGLLVISTNSYMASRKGTARFMLPYSGYVEVLQWTHGFGLRQLSPSLRRTVSRFSNMNTTFSVLVEISSVHIYIEYNGQNVQNKKMRLDPIMCSNFLL